jgi:hypothetical protein
VGARTAFYGPGARAQEREAAEGEARGKTTEEGSGASWPQRESLVTRAWWPLTRRVFVGAAIWGKRALV